VTAKFKTDSETNLTVEYRPLELEREIRAFWEKNQIQQKLAAAREKDNVGVLGFVEGHPR
jgi:isoleucyl-tRNA synthetase